MWVDVQTGGKLEAPCPGDVKNTKKWYHCFGAGGFWGRGGGEAESVERGGRERGDGALKTHHISAASNTDISAAKVVVILQGLHDAPPHPDFFHLDTLKKF